MQLANSFPFEPTSKQGVVPDAVPGKLAVFAIFPDASASGTRPYLSQTRNLRRRLARLLEPPSERSKRLNLSQLARRIEYQVVGSSFEAQWLLYQLHRSYFPRQYRQRLRLRPPAVLKINLRNRFPRCYPTRRLVNDGSIYYGPFPSRLAAERFASEFLDWFKIRRCVEDLDPDPSHPGCIYSQMRMCLAPCFMGCSDAQYHDELGRVVAFLDSEGKSLVRDLESERAQASETMEFEHAAKAHRKLDEVQQVIRLRPGLVRRLDHLHAIIVQRAADPQSVAFFRIVSGEIRGPAVLSLNERVASPAPLDRQIHGLLDSLAADRDEDRSRFPGRFPAPAWESLSLLARWYYSSFREGELVMLPSSEEIPHARLVRLCRKIAQPAT